MPGLDGGRRNSLGGARGSQVANRDDDFGSAQVQGFLLDALGLGRIHVGQQDAAAFPGEGMDDAASDVRGAASDDDARLGETEVHGQLSFLCVIDISE